jgi:CRISPR-associated Csx2 family protein
MAKILISFVGTGRRNKDEKAKREYETASYILNGRVLKNYSFVSLALADTIKPDKVFLIGTVHSMWEEVYSKFCHRNNIPMDEAIWGEVGDYCDKANSQSELSFPHKEDVEKAMGEGSQISLIRYGITEDEIQENINIILKLKDKIKAGDEIIVDITHSFRSLPLYIMQLMMYLKTIDKNITISHVYYGMYEAAENKGPAPIVDLVSVINVNDWIIGAYAFQNYGNATKVAELMEKENKSVSTLLQNFSDAMNLNHIMAINSQIQRLSGIKNTEYKSKIADLIITPSIEKFTNEFRNKEKATFELRLAEWQAQHHNYTAAYISIVESMVTYTCIINKLNDESYDDREKAKDIIRGKISGKCDTLIATEFPKLNKIRNSLAHSIETVKNLNSMIITLHEGIIKIKEIIK